MLLKSSIDQQIFPIIHKIKFNPMLEILGESIMAPDPFVVGHSKWFQSVKEAVRVVNRRNRLFWRAWLSHLHKVSVHLFIRQVSEVLNTKTYELSELLTKAPISGRSLKLNSLSLHIWHRVPSVINWSYKRPKICLL